MTKSSFKKIAVVLVFCLMTTIIYSSSTESFVPFDLGLTEENKQFLQDLNVGSQKSYDNFGHLEDTEQEHVEFFKSMGNDQDQAQSAATIISNMIRSSLQKLEAETAWISIRAFKSDDAYNVPRWHTDGYYYLPYSGSQRKVATALKGPGTLFCKVSEDVRAKIDQIQSEPFRGLTEKEVKSLTKAELEAMTKRSRMKLAELLENHPIVQLPAGEGMLWIVGDQHLAAVHSEPPIHEDRLFISILPGTHDQIKELHDTWHPVK